MATSLQAVADFRAAQISGGRYDRITDGYTYPLPIYVGDTPTVAQDARAAWQFFQVFHAVLLAEGLPHLTGRVVATEIPRDGRFRVWTDWFASATPADRPVAVARTVCYCLGTVADARTEMVDCTALHLPALRAALAA